ncbi:MAG: stage V sporulation protein AB [Lachnospiraceae bacterium]|nr:stage V sporulation protein AB [Lachnospiraceae bacterium]
MLIKYLILILIGLAGGLSIAGGTFAFIVMIGVLPRLAGKTHTAWASWQYENMVIAGGLIGNILYLFPMKVPVGYVGLGLFGVFTGIYVGCFAMALAEVLNIIPIFSRRIKLKAGLAIIITAIAIGKALGSFYQMVLPVIK